MKCASCENKECYKGKDCFNISDDITKFYQEEINHQVMKTASTIEAEHYMKLTRLEEIIMFSKKMNFTRLGLAFCIGLSKEAEIIEKILSKDFEVISVCCKVGGINKKDFGLPHIDESRFETTCDPIGQAKILNKKKTDLNIIVGLCVGHDMLFTKYSKAFVTTLVTKDRVLAHNPLGVIYSGYYKRKFEK